MKLLSSKVTSFSIQDFYMQQTVILLCGLSFALPLFSGKHKPITRQTAALQSAYQKESAYPQLPLLPVQTEALDHLYTVIQRTISELPAPLTRETVLSLREEFSALAQEDGLNSEDQEAMLRTQLLKGILHLSGAAFDLYMTEQNVSKNTTSVFAGIMLYLSNNHAEFDEEETEMIMYQLRDLRIQALDYLDLSPALPLPLVSTILTFTKAQLKANQEFIEDWQYCVAHALLSKFQSPELLEHTDIVDCLQWAVLAIKSQASNQFQEACRQLLSYGLTTVEVIINSFDEQRLMRAGSLIRMTNKLASEPPTILSPEQKALYLQLGKLIAGNPVYCAATVMRDDYAAIWENSSPYIMANPPWQTAHDQLQKLSPIYAARSFFSETYHQDLSFNCQDPRAALLSPKEVEKLEERQQARTARKDALRALVKKEEVPAALEKLLKFSDYSAGILLAVRNAVLLKDLDPQLAYKIYETARNDLRCLQADEFWQLVEQLGTLPQYKELAKEAYVGKQLHQLFKTQAQIANNSYLACHNWTRVRESIKQNTTHPRHSGYLVWLLKSVEEEVGTFCKTGVITPALEQSQSELIGLDKHFNMLSSDELECLAKHLCIVGELHHHSQALTDVLVLPAYAYLTLRLLEQQPDKDFPSSWSSITLLSLLTAINEGFIEIFDLQQTLPRVLASFNIDDLPHGLKTAYRIAQAVNLMITARGADDIRRLAKLCKEEISFPSEAAHRQLRGVCIHKASCKIFNESEFLHPLSALIDCYDEIIRHGHIVTVIDLETRKELDLLATRLPHVQARWKFVRAYGQLNKLEPFYESYETLSDEEQMTLSKCQQRIDRYNQICASECSPKEKLSNLLSIQHPTALNAALKFALDLSTDVETKRTAYLKIKPLLQSSKAVPEFEELKRQYLQIIHNEQQAARHIKRLVKKRRPDTSSNNDNELEPKEDASTPLASSPFSSTSEQQSLCTPPLTAHEEAPADFVSISAQDSSKTPTEILPAPASPIVMSQELSRDVIAHLIERLQSINKQIITQNPENPGRLCIALEGAAELTSAFHDAIDTLGKDRNPIEALIIHMAHLDEKERSVLCANLCNIATYVAHYKSQEMQVQPQDAGLFFASAVPAAAYEVPKAHALLADFHLDNAYRALNPTHTAKEYSVAQYWLDRLACQFEQPSSLLSEEAREELRSFVAYGRRQSSWLFTNKIMPALALAYAPQPPY